MIARPARSVGRLRGENAIDAIVCGSILAYPLIGLASGGSTALVSLLLTSSSIILMLLVLRGERRRNALFHDAIRRLKRETSIMNTFQDR